MVDPTSIPISTGIVLSGGGARGAYEAGVVQGLMEVLQPSVRPFDVLCGTSVGALNATYLAAHAHLPDMGASGLVEHWRELDVATHLRLDLRGLLGWKRDWGGHEKEQLPKLVGRSLLDARALETIVRDYVPWEQLHDNIDSGRVRSVVVSALHIASGRTTIFAELAKGTSFTASRDPRRMPRLTRLEADHVLASAAIPLLFPARRVGNDFYCDGGVRFNTPIAPAIRCGAQRLVVVSLLSQENGSGPQAPVGDRIHAYNSPVFLIGKVLNALLLDPLHYDLQVLDRFNRMISALQTALPPDELEAVQRVIRESRGLPYRRIETLVFRPSRDVGHMARERANELQASRFSSWLLARTATLGSLWESDMVSFILFDSHFAEQLIELGRNDALARADEIHAFFERPIATT
ncbi:MAG: patatin-like phospholipase family protein [Myxococcales bacterium]|nr:patatin-like phospholipase family protein [Myxococcales bacterium]